MSDEHEDERERVIRRRERELGRPLRFNERPLSDYEADMEWRDRRDRVYHELIGNVPRRR